MQEVLVPVDIVNTTINSSGTSNNNREAVVSVNVNAAQNVAEVPVNNVNTTVNIIGTVDNNREAEESEQYELVSIVSVTNLKKRNAAKCDDCHLAACCMYFGGEDDDTFSYCLNCQDK